MVKWQSIHKHTGYRVHETDSGCSSPREVLMAICTRREHFVRGGGVVSTKAEPCVSLHNIPLEAVATEGHGT